MMEEKFTPFTANSFENSVPSKAKFLPSSSDFYDGHLKLDHSASDFIFESASTSQNSNSNGFSPMTEATSDDEERTSLFFNLENGDNQEVAYDTTSFKCSKNLKFLLEAEEEMASIFSNKPRKCKINPLVVAPKENQGSLVFTRKSET